MTTQQKNKSLVTFRFKDLLGSPIPKLKYHVKENKTGRLIADGFTNSKGESVKISRDIGLQLDVYVKKLISNDMKLIKSVTLMHPEMIVNLSSFKLLFDLDLVKHEGDSGKYRRKTYVVKAGDTLDKIAKTHGSTVRELSKLNQLSNPDRLGIGQIIKLPLRSENVSNNSNQGKNKAPAPSKEKNQPSSPPKKTNNSTHPSIDNTPSVLDDVKNKANEIKSDIGSTIDSTTKKAEEVIDYAKELIIGRSADSGSPKAEAVGLCKDNPACIKKGSPPSDLILELNIRLAGFGGALPTNEFTDLTEKCVKQFQRDYMGVSETGKVCGGLLQALDEFRDKYGVSGYFAKASCPCGECSGFGKGRKNIPSGPNKATEYRGIHRSLIWMLKATQFYLINEFKNHSLQVAYIESGYRCIDNNIQKKRTSVNHMGLALDIHFNKKNTRTKELNDMEFIRKNIFIDKMMASEERMNDHIYLEPKKFKSGSAGATTWVHYDVTRFSSSYLANHLFKTNIEELNGECITTLATKTLSKKLLLCAGNGGLNLNQPNQKQPSDTLTLTEQDIIDIMKVTETEVIKFDTEKYFNEQAAGVVDTILNRTKSEVWGKSVRDVVNAYRQFSKITGPASLKPYGAVENMPMSDVSSKIKNFVNNYLIERSNGKPSIIGENLNYANKYYSDAYNRKQWVDTFHDEAVKTGLVFGNGKAIHAHGTVIELRKKMPKPFRIVLPLNFKGIN